MMGQLGPNNRYISILLFVLFLPFSWASFLVGSIYRLLTILLAFIVFIVCRGRFAIGQNNKRTLMFFSVYILYCSLTTVWSVDFQLGINNTMGLMLLLIIAFIFATTQITTRVKSIVLYCWVVMGIISSLMYIFGEKTQVGKYGARTSLMILGTPTDPNEFAGLFCATISLTIIIIMNIKKRVIQALMVFAVCIEIYAVLMTGSRGALLSVIISIFLTLFFLRQFSFKLLIFLVVATTLIGFIFINWVLPSLPMQIMERFSLEALVNDQGSGRLGIWSDALHQFYNNSSLKLLFGYGAGGITAGTTIVSTTMHNQFIQNLVNYGLLGFSLYMVFLVRVFNIFRRQNREYLGAFLGMLAMSMTITMGPSYKPFWILLMMVFLKPIDCESD